MAFDLVHEDGLLLVAYAGVITVDERTRALTAAFAATPPAERRLAWAPAHAGRFLFASRGFARPAALQL